MKFIVWKLIGDGTVKLGQAVGDKYVRYSFKGMDDHKNYYLNLPVKHKDSNYLFKKLREGNIVEAQLQANKNNISFYQPISIVKDNQNGKSYK